MNAANPLRYIWATRGRDWGFRFLRNGGLQDPLSTYERAISPLGEERNAFQQTDEFIVVRFDDPDRRSDAAGRLIPHEFVLFHQAADSQPSFDDVRRLAWNEVSEYYNSIWMLPSSALDQ